MRKTETRSLNKSYHHTSQMKLIVDSQLILISGKRNSF